jgi:hypothetical protein
MAFLISFAVLLASIFSLNTFGLAWISPTTVWTRPQYSASIDSTDAAAYCDRSCYRIRNSKPLFIYAPPGSGYASPDDERSVLPSTYEPMMEFPGTMRPGRTPENQPFQDLPIGDNDPDPVPWPHFQQIEWHHQWEPPHDHPIPMEQFIELQGRWATPEMEATMRAGVRRNVREQKEKEEAERTSYVITDDDDDDDDDDLRDSLDIEEEPVALGDGVFGQLGSDADRAATAVATSPSSRPEVEEDDDEDMDVGDDDLDDFLLDLGLDSDVVGMGERTEITTAPSSSSSKASGRQSKALEPLVQVKIASSTEDDDEDDNEDKTREIAAAITVEDDFDMNLGLDDDDDDLTPAEDGTVSLQTDDSYDSDTIDGEDIFDEGGFDFDDDFGDFDSGDSW